MKDATARGLEEVREKLLDAARQLGELTVVHARLRAEHERLVADADGEDQTVTESAELDEDDAPVARSIDGPLPAPTEDALDSCDRQDYVLAIRRRLYRTLYAIDFTLVQGLSTATSCGTPARPSRCGGWSRRIPDVGRRTRAKAIAMVDPSRKRSERRFSTAPKSVADPLDLVAKEIGHDRLRAQRSCECSATRARKRSRSSSPMRVSSVSSTRADCCTCDTVVALSNEARWS